ncbi:hypothetical protein FACS189468_8380 [Spirochaetia bacterium]|nr:hypothetical protein FACS189468_8380 [Spirochaetia bacterium]
MKRMFCFVALFFIIATAVFAQFYKQRPSAATEIDFSNNSFGVLYYQGFRPSEDDFWDAMATTFFYDMAGTEEILIIPSFIRLENNTALDERVRKFTRENRLTCCTTYYGNEYGGYSYTVNYSFDNYKTFGFMNIESMER